MDGEELWLLIGICFGLSFAASLFLIFFSLYMMKNGLKRR
jgi:uncharacterized membrane protein YqhA